MKVSAIIPTYNEEKVIGECLESLAKQSSKDFEIIVIDDGSEDETLKILEGFKIQDLRFRILHQKHLGAGAARNVGFKQSKGEVLVFVDADMTFDKDFIKKLVNPILKKETIGTFSKDEYLANKNNIWAKCWNINREFPIDRMHTKNYPDTQKVFRAILKKEFEKVGGFNEAAGYVDDWSLSEKLGMEAVVAPGAIFYHKNPETLKEVFIQSKWMAKRKYKLGVVGLLTALVRVSLPISIFVGVYKSFANGLLAFVIFKIISDLGQFAGILEYYLFGKISK